MGSVKTSSRHCFMVRGDKKARWCQCDKSNGVRPVPGINGAFEPETTFTPRSSQRLQSSRPDPETVSAALIGRDSWSLTVRAGEGTPP
jgi:hypothetical protein